MLTAVLINGDCLAPDIDNEVADGMAEGALIDVLRECAPQARFLFFLSITSDRAATLIERDCFCAACVAT